MGTYSPDKLVQYTEFDEEHDRVVEYLENIGVLERGQHSRANYELKHSRARSRRSPRRKHHKYVYRSQIQEP